MAFPVDAARAITNGTGATTSPVVNLPSGITAGETLFILIRNAAGGTITFPNEGTDWIQLFEDSSDASNDTIALAWRKADGTEGATVTLTFGTSGKFAAIAWRITGAADPTVTPPEFASLVTGTSTAPDPGTVTPTGGAKDYLFLWMGGWEGEQTSPPADNPTNYVNPVGADSGTGGAVATNCRVAGASRQLNAASENPSSWTISASDNWTATVVAVHPATAQIYTETVDATFTVLGSETDGWVVSEAPAGAVVLATGANVTAVLGESPSGIVALTTEAVTTSVLDESPSVSLVLTETVSEYLIVVEVGDVTLVLTQSVLDELVGVGQVYIETVDGVLALSFAAAESLAFPETPSITVVFTPAQVEQIVGNEVGSVTFTFVQTADSAVIGTDSPVGTVVLAGAVAERRALSESPSGIVVLALEVADARVLSEVGNVTVLLTPVTAEQIIGQDAPLATIVLTPAQSEQVTGTETGQVTIVLMPAATESVAGVEDGFAAVSLSGAVGESLALSESPSITASLILTVSDAAVFFAVGDVTLILDPNVEDSLGVNIYIETADGNIVLVPSVASSAVLPETLDITVVLTPAQAEGIAFHEQPDGTISALGTVDASAIFSDAQNVTVILSGSVADVAQFIDILGITAVLTLGVTEDHVVAVLSAPGVIVAKVLGRADSAAIARATATVQGRGITKVLRRTDMQ